MRILFLNPSAELGGAERLLLDLVECLRVLRPHWKLKLIVSQDGPLLANMRGAGVETAVVRFPDELERLGDSAAGGPAGMRIGRFSLAGALLSAGPAVAAVVRELRHEILSWKADLIHTNGLKMHVLGAWSRTNEVPVVWHLHDFVGCRPVMSRLVKSHARWCACAIANSEAVAGDLRRVAGDSLDTHTVLNGINLERFSPAGPAIDLDRAAGLSGAGPEIVRVGLIATMARWKGQDIFLQAISRLPANLPIRAYIVGGPVYRTAGSQWFAGELEGLARELGIAQKVGFTGFMPEPAAATRALDVVVHASTQPEPFGLVIAEAMACGKAAIVSEAASVPELVSPGEDALTHPAGDSSVLAARIADLAQDHGLRTRLGHAARLSAQRRFDRTRMASQIASIYESLRAA